MCMQPDLISEFGETLYRALLTRDPIDPLTETVPDISIEDAYRISQYTLQRRLDEGEVLVGKKIGVTSKAVQQMLLVDQPDFGYLTDRMVYSTGEAIPVSETMIQPKAEGEIAFVLNRDLKGPGVTNADVLRATEGVMPCFEIVDSRIKDWKIKIQDTVADNASCGALVLGGSMTDPRRLDLSTCGLVFEKNGEIVATGAGAAALNSPVNSVAWLANTLGRLGESLKAGEVILSGSLVPLIPVTAGDSLAVRIGGIGDVSVRLT